jgi:hypothetical protein
MYYVLVFGYLSAGISPPGGGGAPYIEVVEVIDMNFENNL